MIDICINYIIFSHTCSVLLYYNVYTLLYIIVKFSTVLYITYYYVRSDDFDLRDVVN